VLGTWFVLLRAEPVALHACPMHGQGHAHGAVPTPAAVAPSVHAVDHGTDAHAHADHGTSSTAPALHEAPSPSDEETPAGCLCLGHCCAAGAAVLPVVGVVVALLAPTPLDGPEALPRASERAPRAAPSRLLPFANGPPAPLS
jgi:hypothetical protein